MPRHKFIDNAFYVEVRVGGRKRLLRVASTLPGAENITVTFFQKIAGRGVSRRLVVDARMNTREDGSAVSYIEATATGDGTVWKSAELFRLAH